VAYIINRLRSCIRTERGTLVIRSDLCGLTENAGQENDGQTL